MSEILTVELPDELARQARALAAATNQPFQEAVVEWISRAVAEPIVESLQDNQILSLCDAEWDAIQQKELSDLLARLREGPLTDVERPRLDELMTAYRHDLVLKARAWKEAVARGLRPPLDTDAA